MCLTDEKEKLKQLAIRHRSGFLVDGVDCAGKNSYFIPYLNSRHFGASIELYDTTEIYDVRKRMKEIYEGDELAEKYFSVLIASLYKTREVISNNVTPLELFNYMM